MKIKIISVGYLKQRQLNELIADYKKQIKDITIIEVPDEKEVQGMKKEGEQILNKIHKEEYVISLAIEGKKMNSEAFSAHLDKVTTFQTPQVTFIIGGSFGLSDEVKQRSDLLLSFSDFTFPHQLMRLMLIEQIYRAISILKKHPYHK